MDSTLKLITTSICNKFASGLTELFRKVLPMNSCLSSENVVSSFVLDSSNEEILVRAAKVGEHSAFSELWRRYSTRIFRSAYRITGNREDAEDALQNAFLSAFVHLKSFDGRSTFATWLTRIAINSSLMVLRKQRARPEISIDWSADNETAQTWEVEDRRVNIEEHYAAKETEQYLQRAISRLRPSLRNVVEFRRAHESSVKEVAENAGISINAAKSRLMRARTSLRQSLESRSSQKREELRSLEYATPSLPRDATSSICLSCRRY
jgi:RNA polymerase sigma factor (sigma-70 family)